LVGPKAATFICQLIIMFDIIGQIWLDPKLLPIFANYVLMFHNIGQIWLIEILGIEVALIPTKMRTTPKTHQLTNSL